jgi:hypothetical protein
MATAKNPLDDSSLFSKARAAENALNVGPKPKVVAKVAAPAPKIVKSAGTGLGKQTVTHAKGVGTIISGNLGANTGFVQLGTPHVTLGGGAKPKVPRVTGHRPAGVGAGGRGVTPAPHGGGTPMHPVKPSGGKGVGASGVTPAPAKPKPPKAGGVSASGSLPGAGAAPASPPRGGRNPRSPMPPPRSTFTPSPTYSGNTGPGPRPSAGTKGERGGLSGALHYPAMGNLNTGQYTEGRQRTTSATGGLVGGRAKARGNRLNPKRPGVR